MGASQPDRPRGRILLIDDDPALGGFLSRVLRSRGGFEVTHELDPAGISGLPVTAQWATQWAAQWAAP
jgi:DNA-binding response OmpR family regulator